MHNDTRRVAMLVQSGYYVGTGLLPFASRRAFEAVTGPKREWWLVQTVGALVTVVGGALASGAARDRVTPELLGVALGSAGALATIDVVYVARRRISPAYLLDAALQAGLFAVLARSERSHGSGRGGWRRAGRDACVEEPALAR
jgi:hypothetical protein